jgi:hypothetical protein
MIPVRGVQTVQAVQAVEESPSFSAGEEKRGD